MVKTRDGTGGLSTLSGEGKGADSAIGWPPTHPGGRIETLRRREGRERGLPGETPLAGQVWPGCLLSGLDPVAPADVLRIKQHAQIAMNDFRVRCRSEEHTSELQSLMRSPYTVFCLKNKKKKQKKKTNIT